MKKINFYIVQTLIEELSYVRYNLMNIPELHDDFIMVAKIGSTIYVATYLDKHEFEKKVTNIFMGTTGAIGEFIIYDMTEPLTSGSISFNTTDSEILKMERIIHDIRTANSVHKMNNDLVKNGEDDEGIVKYEKSENEIPTLDDLLDKIAKSGMNSLNENEQKLLKNYSE